MEDSATVAANVNAVVVGLEGESGWIRTFIEGGRGGDVLEWVEQARGWVEIA